MAPRDGGPVIISDPPHTTATNDLRPLALITGAARRLGAVMARYLHARGYDLAIHHHASCADAAALVAELNARRSHSAFALVQDLAAGNAATALLAELRRQRDRLDLLVNNASVFEPTPVSHSDVADWDRIHAINVRAPYFLALEAAPLLRHTRGSIVNIADIHARHPRLEYSMYCISKAALVAATRALALELAPEVRVNCVAPGAILWAASEDAALQAAAVAATPLQRCGEPEDIAAAVAYLAGAEYVTGHVINVDGGRALGV